MTTKEFRLPDPGEGLTEAEIVEWKVAVGDTVKVNDIVVEIETAKSLVELPVPFAGTVVALLVAEGETVEVGTPIIAVDTGGDDQPGPPPAAEPSTTVAAAVGSQSGSTATPAPPATERTAAPPAPERTAVLVGYGVKQTEAKRRPRHTVPASKPEESVVPSPRPAPGSWWPRTRPKVPSHAGAFAAPSPGDTQRQGPRQAARAQVRQGPRRRPHRHTRQAGRTGSSPAPMSTRCWPR